ncbi:MAG: HAMP domain-containing histidine kinase [Clostridia bacterium]|nr:HAMP domain-containing histidine kinase [Clostridia bacterium]
MKNTLITTKSWQYRAWIAGFVTLAVILALCIGIVVQVRQGGDDVAQKTMSQYAELIKDSGESSLFELVEEDSESAYLYRENIDVIVYVRRPDNTAGDYTAVDYLKEHTSAIPNRFDTTVDEKIGNYRYKTYTFVYRDGVYVKLLMQADLLEKYESVDAFIWFIPITVILVLAIYTAFAFLMGKPVVKAIEQQKEFIHDMTHEIRTPLTVIRGNMENMLAAPDSTVMQLSDLVENTLEEVQHITTLSQDLMRSVSAPTANPKSSSDVSEIILGVLEVYSEIIGESNRTLIANVQSANTVMEGEKVKQLAIILLENAVKYTSEKDKIKVSLKSADGGCVLSVADTGIGIADGEEEKIFQRFYRGENVKTSKPGTGLGLAIARSIVEEIGGKIYATPNLPSGLIVTAFLPQRG